VVKLDPTIQTNNIKQLFKIKEQIDNQIKSLQIDKTKIEDQLNELCRDFCKDKLKEGESTENNIIPENGE
jgi:DNA integrity scanning protein DisA with diadenylate cyclase activity